MYLAPFVYVASAIWMLFFVSGSVKGGLTESTNLVKRQDRSGKILNHAHNSSSGIGSMEEAKIDYELILRKLVWSDCQGKVETIAVQKKMGNAEGQDSENPSTSFTENKIDYESVIRNFIFGECEREIEMELNQSQERRQEATNNAGSGDANKFTVNGIDMSNIFSEIDQNDHDYVMFGELYFPFSKAEGSDTCDRWWWSSAVLNAAFGLVPFSNRVTLEYRDVEKYVEENWEVIEKYVLQSSDEEPIEVNFIKGTFLWDGIASRINKTNYATYLYAYQQFFVREHSKNPKYCACELPAKQGWVKCSAHFKSVLSEDTVNGAKIELYISILKNFTYPDYWNTTINTAIQQFQDPGIPVPWLDAPMEKSEKKQDYEDIFDSLDLHECDLEAEQENPSEVKNPNHDQGKNADNATAAHAPEHSNEEIDFSTILENFVLGDCDEEKNGPYISSDQGTNAVNAAAAQAEKHREEAMESSTMLQNLVLKDCDAEDEGATIPSGESQKSGSGGAMVEGNIDEGSILNVLSLGFCIDEEENIITEKMNSKNDGKAGNIGRGNDINSEDGSHEGVTQKKTPNSQVGAERKTLSSETSESQPSKDKAENEVDRNSIDKSILKNQTSDATKVGDAGAKKTEYPGKFVTPKDTYQPTQPLAAPLNDQTVKANAATVPSGYSGSSPASENEYQKPKNSGSNAYATDDKSAENLRITSIGQDQSSDALTLVVSIYSILIAGFFFFA